MRRIISVVLFIMFMTPFAGWAVEEYTIMRPDHETLMKWVEYYENAPRTPYVSHANIPPRGSKSLLSHWFYIPSERDQGACGNCWAWAGTGCMEVALNVQEGVSDRLSVQYINSCEYEVIRKICCSGGWLEDLTEFYGIVKKAVPLSNANAYYQDKDASCDTPCNTISTNPHYPIKYIQAMTIPTQGVGKEAAIANIKNVLNQDKAIWFAFYLPTSEDWNAFFTFWSSQTEADLWNHDFVCDKTWSAGAGGHAVLCVGYNDDDPENSYWILVNSWGSSTGRPNGIFRVDMNMNYDCSFKYGTGTLPAFYWQTLDMAFNMATPTPTPVPGNTCLNPIVVSDSGIFSNSTKIFQNIYNPSYAASWPYSWGMPGQDCVFKIDVSESLVGQPLSVKILSSNFDNAVYAVWDCGDPGNALIAVGDDYADNTGEEISWTIQNPGEVYVMVDSYHNAVSGDFEIEFNVASTPEPTPTATSTSTPTPTPTPTPFIMPEEYVYNFDQNSEGWHTTSSPEVFDAPSFFEAANSIGFSASGSDNCFGSWESPCHAFTAGQKYRARFRVWTSQPTPSLVPAFRIRIADKQSQSIFSLMINSLGEGENSPTVSGKIYEVLYQPPATALSEGYFISVELINIGSSDDANAQIGIDLVEIKKANVTIP
ncbi:hypothetical protein JW926_06565 [Candidatus Sumerlaeota bacterium]|nr:hypothetical protein [Candidatus Sumerlaeota bacterium]